MIVTILHNVSAAGYSCVYKGLFNEILYGFLAVTCMDIGFQSRSLLIPARDERAGFMTYMARGIYWGFGRACSDF